MNIRRNFSELREKFFYLEEKIGGSIVVNDAYYKFNYTYTLCISDIILQYMRLERQMNIVLGMHFMEEWKRKKREWERGSVRKQEKMMG